MSPKDISKFRIQGLITAPCTPFDENGEIAPHLIESYVDHILKFGIKNVFSTGSCGEGPMMTLEERKRVTEAWVKYGANKLDAVVAHIGAGNVKECKELAAHAEKTGVDAIACVGATYFKPDSLDTYIEYMAEVAASAPNTPFYLYDIDDITGIKISSCEFFHAVGDRIPNLRGVKHTTKDFYSMNGILNDFGDKYQVVAADDKLYLEALVLGIESNVCTSYFGHVLNRVKKAFDAGDLKSAREEQAKIFQLCDIRDRHGLWGPSMIKGPMKAIGLDLGQPRLPLIPVSDAKVKSIKADMEKVGFFDWAVKP